MSAVSAFTIGIASAATAAAASLTMAWVPASASAPAGLIPEPGAAHLYSTIAGINQTYPTVFPSSSKTVQVTVLAGLNLSANTTAQFDACTKGLSTGARSKKLGDQFLPVEGGGGVGVFTVPAPAFSAGVTSGACGLYLSDGTQAGSGYVDGPGAGGVYRIWQSDCNGPNTQSCPTGAKKPYWLYSFTREPAALASVTPDSAIQAAPNPIPVVLKGSNLPDSVWLNSTARATGTPVSVPAGNSVFQTNCRGGGADPLGAVQMSGSSNPSKVADDVITTVLNNGTVGSSTKDATCDVIVPIPGTANPRGYDLISLPQAFTYLHAYQGPITVTITNNSETPDTDLYVSVVGKLDGTISGFDGFNIEKLTTVAFTDLVDLSNKKTYTSSGQATGGTASFQVMQPVDSGVIYLSNANMATGSKAPNPETSKVRYAMAEFTYNKSFFSDLTLIDQIGYSMSSELYSDQDRTTEIDDSNRTTGCLADLVTGVKGIVPTAQWSKANADGTGGVIRYAADRSTVVGYVGAAKKPEAYLQDSVEGYVKYVQGLGTLRIRDQHNAANQPGEFDYAAVYDSATDLWTMTGTIENGKGAGPKLVVESSSIYAPGTNGGTGYAMYGEDGPFKVVLDGVDKGWGNGAQVAGTGYQDLVKTIYRDFIAGFAYGYWGGKYGGGTDTGPAAVNFTHNPNQDAYSNAGVPGGRGAWNQYDELIRSSTSGGGGAAGAYGTAYSDTFVPSALSPAIGTSFAQNWTITLGDPPECGKKPTPKPLSLAPTPQHVKVDVGTPIETAVLAASGFPGAVTYSVSPALPTGLSLNTATGVISGTPTVEQSTKTYTITGASETDQAIAQVTIKVGEDPTPPGPTPTPTPIYCPPPGWIQDGQCLEPA